jgi:hypothetical protein
VVANWQSMQDSTVDPGSIASQTESARPQTLKEVRRALEYQGSIFFEKTLARSNAPNLHKSQSHTVC